MKKKKSEIKKLEDQVEDITKDLTTEKKNGLHQQDLVKQRDS